MKNTRLYLRVPFEEKDEAKALGARWDPNRKEWYATYINSYHLLKKWFYKQDADIILFDYMFIALSNRTCFKCNKQTPVIALASNNYSNIYKNNKIVIDGNVEFLYILIFLLTQYLAF